MNFFLNFIKTKKAIYYILPFSIITTSFSLYSLNTNIFNSKKIEEDIIDKYKSYRDITD